MTSARAITLLLVLLLEACSKGTSVQPSQVPVETGAALDSSGGHEPARLPYYARLERDFEPVHSDEWAAIVFYRQPGCVRPGFNLLDFIDIPAAFGCTVTVEGFAIFKDPFPARPIQVNLQGLGAVPIWFVSWPELQAAMADGVVRIGDLQGTRSLVIGSASIFHETLHPGEKLVMTAQGMLADRRAFGLEVSYAGGALRHVSTAFR